MRKYNVIAIDFDGVIHNQKTGEPIPGAKEGISKLREDRWTVIIYSCNSQFYIEKWLNNQEIIVDGIFGERDGKPIADIYLDDRALRFYNWTQTLNELPYLTEEKVIKAVKVAPEEWR